ncbi:hypothetical protein K470DRAFT_262955 [Piedraia hortae CBS 480.64]|uniref:Uncharacterized protein n=1 Tax=Piedraia hortae CBS 480.64 TaxID=1314780 RepID=A0A6A7C5W4_9PEZI|nr:hypothetical protein K470DRAFT_262955 [Piedraia hortae CBS 480.64]
MSHHKQTPIYAPKLRHAHHLRSPPRNHSRSPSPAKGQQRRPLRLPGEVIGAITHHSFAQRDFVEIINLATDQQESGPGRYLMDKFKDYIRSIMGVTHIIGYGDLEALG